MKRLPSAKDLEKLEQLTKAREMAALAELGQIAAERRIAEASIAELIAQDHQAHSVEDAEIISKWRIWRAEELRRRAARLAAVVAEHQTAAKKCGKLIAEYSVVERIAQLARQQDAAAQGRTPWITSPDEQYL